MIELKNKPKSNKNTSSASIIICLFLAVTLAMVGSASADTITVDDDGGANYSTIQDAIDAANDGDTILVSPGTYEENLVIDGKAVNLISTDGREDTTIQPDSQQTNAIELSSSTSGIQIGGDGQGFTIIGSEPTNQGLETAAVYLKGVHSDMLIEGNEIVAGGDSAVLTEWGAAVSNLSMVNNIISGQTFVGDKPAGQGSENQFTLWNVPRALVYIGGKDKSDITFVGNDVTGVAGGLNENGEPQGNQVVNIDADGAVITDNLFTGETAWTAASLRTRGTDTVIEDNNFKSGDLLNLHVILDENTVTGGSDTVFEANDFDRSVNIDGGLAVFTNIQGAIDAAEKGSTLEVAPGTYEEIAENRDAYSTNNQPYDFGLYINKDDLIIRGVDDNGNPITDYNNIKAEVISQGSTNFGTNGPFIAGNNVTISGLEITPNPDVSPNKNIEIAGDGVKLVNNNINGKIGSVYFSTGDVQNFSVTGNYINASLSFNDGVGNETDMSNRIVKNNNVGIISLAGEDTDVAWRNNAVGPVTIEDNIIRGHQYVLTYTDNGEEKTYVYNGVFSRLGTITDPMDWDMIRESNTFERGVYIPDNSSPTGIKNTGDDTADYYAMYYDIQKAVDNAENGDTVVAGDGVYDENVKIDDEIVLSAGSSPVINGGIELNSDNIGIDGLHIKDGGTLSGNQKAGIYIVAGTSGHTIINSTIERTAEYDNYPGIMFGYDVSNISVKNNDMTGWYQGSYINPSDAIDFKDNDFCNNYVGIASDGINNLTLSYNNFTDNELEGWGYSDSKDVGGDNLEAYCNNFSGNPTAIANYDASDTINATNNYWGSEAGPEHELNTYNKSMQGDKVNGNVVFTPWLTAPCPEGENFAPVEIINPGGGYSSIQAAVNNADEGDTILAKAGTYTENVSVTKDVTITGEEGSLCEKPTVLEGKFDIKVDGVTVKNFKITNTGNSGEIEGMFIGNPAGYTDDPDKVIEVSSNVIDGINSTSPDKVAEGIHIKSYDNGDPIDGVIIKENLIRNVTKTEYGANGIKLQADVKNITILSNKIQDVRGTWSYGITATDSSDESGIPNDIVIKYNIFDNITASVYEGVAVGVEENADADELVVNSNCFTNTHIGALNKNSESTMDARYNYWNSSTGPYNETTSPDGAYASGNVIFEPYSENCADITIEKYTNGVDADTPKGPNVQIGTNVTWTYNITNTGNVKLYNITVMDDKQGEIDCPEITLMPGESVKMTKTGSAEQGQYSNTANVTGDTLCNMTVTDSDSSHYFGYDHWTEVPTANPVLLIGVLGIAVLLFLRREQQK